MVILRVVVVVFSISDIYSKLQFNIWLHIFNFISQVWFTQIILPKYSKEQHPSSNLKFIEHHSFNIKILCCKTQSITSSIKAIKETGAREGKWLDQSPTDT